MKLIVSPVTLLSCWTASLLLSGSVYGQSIRGAVNTVEKAVDTSVDVAADILPNIRDLATIWDDQPRSFDKAAAVKMARLSEKTYTSPTDLSALGLTLLKTFPIQKDFALLASSPGYCYVSFRGSDDVNDWLSNLDTSWVEFKKSTGELMCLSHKGFTNTYNSYRASTSSFLDNVRACLGTSNKLWITGHSRGAAIGALMAVHFALDESLDNNAAGVKTYDLSRFRVPGSADITVFTYGEPRSLSRGNQNKSWTAVHNIPKYRFVNNKDIVPSIPFSPFEHWGASYQLSSTNTVKQVALNFPSFSLGNNVGDHSISLYSSRLAAVSV